MNACYRAADLPILQRSQPSGLCIRILRDPGTDGVNYENIRQTRDDRLAARPQFPSFGSHEPQRTRDPIAMRRIERIQNDQSRQKVDQLMCGRVIELKDSTDGGCWSSATA